MSHENQQDKKIDDGPESGLQQLKLRLEVWWLALRITVLLLAVGGATQLSGLI